MYCGWLVPVGKTGWQLPSTMWNNAVTTHPAQVSWLMGSPRCKFRIKMATQPNPQPMYNGWGMLTKLCGRFFEGRLKIKKKEKNKWKESWKASSYQSVSGCIPGCADCTPCYGGWKCQKEKSSCSKTHWWRKWMFIKVAETNTCKDCSCLAGNVLRDSICGRRPKAFCRGRCATTKRAPCVFSSRRWRLEPEPELIWCAWLQNAFEAEFCAAVNRSALLWIHLSSHLTEPVTHSVSAHFRTCQLR